MNKDWIVASATTVDERGWPKRSFERNAVGLTESEARAEATRRNAIEEANGNKGRVDWFPCEDPRVVVRRVIGKAANDNKGEGQ
jgi:hypothetical protein